MATMEQQLQQDERAEEQGVETEVRLPVRRANEARRDRNTQTNPSNAVLDGQRHDRNDTVPIRLKKKEKKEPTPKSSTNKQKLGSCVKCGYLSSQPICQACNLLEGLNKSRPKSNIAIEVNSG